MNLRIAMKRYLMLAATVLVIGVPTFTAHADDQFTRKPGKLSVRGDYVSQSLELTNLTNKSFSFIQVSCGFFRDQDLITADTGVLQNLGPKETGFVNATSLHAPGTTSTKCRVEIAR